MGRTAEPDFGAGGAVFDRPGGPEGVVALQNKERGEGVTRVDQRRLRRGKVEEEKLTSKGERPVNCSSKGSILQIARDRAEGGKREKDRTHMLARRTNNPQRPLPLSRLCLIHLLLPRLTQPQRPLLPPIQLSHLALLDPDDALEPLFVTEGGEEVESSFGLGGVEMAQRRDILMVIMAAKKKGGERGRGGREGGQTDEEGRAEKGEAVRTCAR